MSCMYNVMTQVVGMLLLGYSILSTLYLCASYNPKKSDCFHKQHRLVF